eukprot:CAMPEP_0201913018 /NCGR_PEP_ID=MMETSP0903-20130614/3540_1 /ASSEMBLY_ACC=CAM_ASM_000552 /TAXON_ID=420261 /ORGANISM="Thalassiosira antarctica, Strain CCMP982" /LENGTH=47 /DNA_ID= /DNA_START= /DNA_END= /DNA_ORIENTATION=
MTVYYAILQMGHGGPSVVTAPQTLWRRHQAASATSPEAIIQRVSSQQ